AARLRPARRARARRRREVAARAAPLRAARRPSRALRRPGRALRPGPRTARARLRRRLREEGTMSESAPRARRGFDEEGLGPEAVIAELDAIARAEDRVWADGRCSGTIYCGDRAIYALIGQAFARFSYVNA